MEDNFKVKSFSLTYDDMQSFIDVIADRKKVYGRFIYSQRNEVERKIGLGELTKETLPSYLTDFSLFLYTAPDEKMGKDDFDFWIDSDGKVSIKGSRQVVADKEKTCKEFIENHKNNNRFIHTFQFSAFKFVLSYILLVLCVFSIANFRSAFPISWAPYFTELSTLIILISCSVLLLMIAFLLTYIYPYASIGARRHTTLNKVLSVSGTVIGIAGIVLMFI